MNKDKFIKEAKILLNYLQQEFQDTEFTLSDALDGVAKINGFTDWQQLENSLDIKTHQYETLFDYSIRAQ